MKYCPSIFRTNPRYLSTPSLPDLSPSTYSNFCLSLSSFPLPYLSPCLSNPQFPTSFSPRSSSLFTSVFSHFLYICISYTHVYLLSLVLSLTYTYLHTHTYMHPQYFKPAEQFRFLENFTLSYNFFQLEGLSPLTCLRYVS